MAHVPQVAHETGSENTGNILIVLCSVFIKSYYIFEIGILIAYDIIVVPGIITSLLKKTLI